jgi:hypothetical protein
MKLETAANILAKIGNPTRLKIVRHHISHLKSAGVIRQERQQATLICKIEYDVINNLVAYLTEECCADAITRDNAA